MLLAQMIVAVAGALGVAASPAPSASPASTGSPLPALEIYSRAVHEMRSLAQAGNPRYLVFDLQIESHNLHWYPTTDGGVTSWDTKLVHANETSNYRVWYRSKDKRALVQDSASHAAYRGESPFVPEAANFSEVSGATPSPSPSPGTSNTSAASGQVIGAITVSGSRYYAVTLVGVEDRAGHPVYHLHLRAYHNPPDNPLTDLWVDTTDYRVWAAHGEVTVRAVAAALGIGVTADFAPVDNRWLVSTIDFTMKGYAMFWHANVATSMRTHVVSAPASLPASYFNP